MDRQEIIHFVPAEPRPPTEDPGRFLIAPLKIMDTIDLSQTIMLEIVGDGYEHRQKTALAIELAAYLHQDDTRGGTNVEKPYISHPLRNALRIIRYGCTDSDIVAAAILHDTVEDHCFTMYELYYGVKTTDEETARHGALAMLTDLFGAETSRIVEAVSNPLVSDEISKSEKTALYRSHVAEAIHDPKVFMVKFSDWVDNAVGLHHTEGTRIVWRLANKYLPLADIFEEMFEQHRNYLPVNSNGLQAIQDHIKLGRERLSLLAAA